MKLKETTSHTVYFNSNGGGSVSPTSMSVTNGEIYGPMPTPTRTGYDFTGWYTSQSGGDRIYSSTTVNLSKDQTLYAHWTAKQYTVYFDANGGSVSQSSKTVTYGSAYGELPTPTRTGYDFAGWYTSSSGGDRVYGSTTVKITASQTLYALWSAQEFVIENGVLTKYNGSGGNVTIPYGVTSIGDDAFSGCTSLTSVTIPGSVTSIGVNAFRGCTSLASVTIPNSVTSIGVCAFFGTRLTSVTIPNSVTNIGEQAFAYCGSLTSVTLQNGVSSIGYSAFFCSGLTKVTIPGSVTSFEHAFACCQNLKNVTILNGVKSIDRWAFFDCESLASVTIPSSVTSIGNQAFDICPSITHVYYGGSAAQWKKITIGSSNEPLTKAAIHYAVAPVTPAAPTKLTAASGANGASVTLTWKNGANTATVSVYRKAAGETSFTRVASGVTGTSCTDKTTKPGTKYTYRVRAYSADGKASDYSNEAAVTTKLAAPAAPTKLTAASGANGKSVTLTWKNGANTATVSVYRKADGATSFTRVASGVTGTSCTDKSTQPGTKYTYRVRAYASDGKTASGYSNEFTLTTKTGAASVLVGATAGAGKITFRWNAVDGATKYVVCRKTAGGAWEQVGTVKNGTAYDDTNVTPGVTYTYTIRAYVNGKWTGYLDKTGVSATAR